MKQLIQAPLVFSTSLNVLHCWDIGLLITNERGTIVLMRQLERRLSAKSIDELKEKYNIVDRNILILDGTKEFLCPGFIDCHTHASQYPNLGLGFDVELKYWLENLTYPTEAQFQDLEFATKTYSQLVDEFLSNGTTTACYYTTVHLEAAKSLADIVNQKGQRAWVGKVCSDLNCPPELMENTEGSISQTEQFIQYLQTGNFSKKKLIKPCITPRFVPSCSSRLMDGLGKLAILYQVPMQTHLCETEQEIKLALDTHPNANSYTSIYSQFGLLETRAMMGHCIHLSKLDIEILKRKKCGIAHCPSSNYNLNSGLCDVLGLIKNNLDVGLGTDISAGSSVSMLDAIRLSVVTSRSLHLTDSVKYPHSLRFYQAFYLSTLGGAKAMGIDDVTGTFKEGLMLDCLIINTEELANLKPIQSLKHRVDRFLMLGSKNNIRTVIVDSNYVHIK